MEPQALDESCRVYISGGADKGSNSLVQELEALSVHCLPYFWWIKSYVHNIPVTTYVDPKGAYFVICWHTSTEFHNLWQANKEVHYKKFATDELTHLTRIAKLGTGLPCEIVMRTTTLFINFVPKSHSPLFYFSNKCCQFHQNFTSLETAMAGYYLICSQVIEVTRSLVEPSTTLKTFCIAAFNNGLPINRRFWKRRRLNRR